MRKQKPRKRYYEPDPRFGDQLVSIFVNNLMLDGKRSVAQKIFYGAMDIIEEKSGESGHEAWKKANGYSDLEVEQKRQSLERVMLVDSESAHLDRFESVGFKSVHQWYRCLNWASFMMYK